MPNSNKYEASNDIGMVVTPEFAGKLVIKKTSSLETS